MGEPARVGALGLVGIILVVLTAGRLARQPLAVPPTTWAGLLNRVDLTRPSLLPAALLAGVALMLLAWWRAWYLADHGLLSARQATVLLVCWMVPLTIGPPILSLDVYSYAAHGTMLAAGLDPYQLAPVALPPGSQALAAVDPMWRSVLAPYGPLAMAAFRAAYQITGGSLIGVVLVLRGLAAGGIALIATGVAYAAPPGRRAQALAAGALNPIVIFQLFGAIHLEATMVGLLVAGLWATQRNRPVLGLMLLTAAAAIKWPAFLAVVVVIVWRAAGADTALPAGRGRVLWTAVRDLAVVGTVTAAMSLLVPDGFGWLRATGTPTAGPTQYSPTSIVADVLGRLTAVLSGVTPAGGTLLTIAHVAGAAAFVVIVGWLLVTVRSRSLTATAGWALIALAGLGPVLHPWYLTWGLVPLAIAPTARGRSGVLVVTVAGTFLAIQHCSLLLADRPSLLQWLRGNAAMVAIGGYAAAVVVVAVVNRRRRAAASLP
ncbi:MAG: polyprenol phosphomannose-dependent alpha 1,6 mannosyltransferase MptB [Frankia sp.]